MKALHQGVQRGGPVGLFHRDAPGRHSLLQDLGLPRVRDDGGPPQQGAEKDGGLFGVEGLQAHRLELSQVPAVVLQAALHPVQANLHSIQASLHLIQAGLHPVHPPGQDPEGLGQLGEAAVGLGPVGGELLVVAALGLGQLGEAAVDFGAELQELLAVGDELLSVGNELLAMGDELLAVGGEFLGQAPEAFLRAALGLGQLGEAAVGLRPDGRRTPCSAAAGRGRGPG
jgi:hypothetical protein